MNRIKLSREFGYFSLIPDATDLPRYHCSCTSFLSLRNTGLQAYLIMLDQWLFQGKVLHEWDMSNGSQKEEGRAYPEEGLVLMHMLQDLLKGIRLTGLCHDSMVSKRGM